VRIHAASSVEQASSPAFGSFRAAPALARVFAVSALLVVPCFWQSRIQAGDLSSHVYNAWLSLLIERGQVEGLVIAPQWTNVLFDLFLAHLVKLVGLELAQRIAVSTAVLVFFWGAFAVTRAVAGRWSWFMAPCLAILAYGWVFHMGFFNFYLSLGLCFFAFALFWKGSRQRRLVAMALLLLAGLAHPLPVVWTAAMGGYVWLAGKLSARGRLAVTLSALGAVVVVRVLVTIRLESFWWLGQALFITGADQARLFGPKYALATLGLLVFWFTVFVNLIDARSARAILLGIPFQVFLLNAAAISLIPTTLILPAYRAPAFVTLRMSLAVGVLVCAFLAAATVKRWQTALITAVTVFFFSNLYIDTRELNRIEDRLEAVIDRLPPGQRVVSSLCDMGGINYQLVHLVDRACIGRCFSYANYEPSSGQFRIRAARPNSVVFSERRQVEALEGGNYIVRERDLPLYQIAASGPADRQLHVRSPGPGEVVRQTCLDLMGSFDTAQEPTARRWMARRVNAR